MASGNSPQDHTYAFDMKCSYMRSQMCQDGFVVYRKGSDTHTDDLDGEFPHSESNAGFMSMIAIGVALRTAVDLSNHVQQTSLRPRRALGGRRQYE